MIYLLCWSIIGLLIWVFLMGWGIGTGDLKKYFFWAKYKKIKIVWGLTLGLFLTVLVWPVPIFITHRKKLLASLKR